MYRLNINVCPCFFERWEFLPRKSVLEVRKQQKHTSWSRITVEKFMSFQQLILSDNRLCISCNSSLVTIFDNGYNTRMQQFVRAADKPLGTDTSHGRACLSSDKPQFRRFVHFEYLAIWILREKNDFLQSSATPFLSMAIANNLRTVPPFVTAHTFWASRDIRVS